MRKLTTKQRRFVEEYALDCNATAAARRAGYAPQNADRVGPELLGKTCVRAAIDEALLDRAERCQVSADWVLKNLRDVVERCMKPKEILDSQGKATGVYRFDSRGACRALELIGKHVGMFRSGGGGNQPVPHFHVHATGQPVNGVMMLPAITEVVVNRPTISSNRMPPPPGWPHNEQAGLLSQQPV